MSNAQWIGGPPEARPTTWIDHTGKAHIDPLAFSATDEAGRKMLLEGAAQLEADFASRPPTPSTPITTAFTPSASGTNADALLRATDDLIAAHLLFVNVLGDFRDTFKARGPEEL